MGYVVPLACIMAHNVYAHIESSTTCNVSADIACKCTTMLKNGTKANEVKVSLTCGLSRKVIDHQSLMTYLQAKHHANA